MKKFSLILIVILGLSVTNMYADSLVTDFDIIIDEIYREIKEHDREINRINNIVDQIENKYCTKEDLVFGMNYTNNQINLYKDSLNKLEESQKNKFESIGILERSKEFYNQLFDKQEQSTLNVIEKWKEQNNLMEVEKLEFKYPVKNPSISSSFGKRVHPIFGTEDFHGGTDFKDSRGTNIYASESGIVIFAQYNQSYGNAVVIMHGDGYFTLYGHIDYDGILVEIGDSVKQGEVIAKMGSTGMSTGNHVHFEIIKDGNKVNAIPYLR